MNHYVCNGDNSYFEKILINGKELYYIKRKIMLVYGFLAFQPFNFKFFCINNPNWKNDLMNNK
jgi:hypothetical protein